MEKNNLKEISEKLKVLLENDNDIKEIKDRIESAKGNIRVAEEYMNRNYQALRESMKKLEVALQQKDGNRFLKELQHIAEHPLTKDIRIKDNYKLCIETDYIDIFDEDGNKYQGNKYEIVFNYNSFNVKFYGLDEEYCRQSYWTEHDPHPHVDGDTGNGCLGDAGSMISVSMNEYELYASYIIAINFLQQVNTSDVAGKYIKNWDCINEQGDIIENPHKESKKCYSCGEDLDECDEDQIYECPICGNTFCEDCVNWIEDEQRYICTDCCDEYYTYCENCNNYVSNEDLMQFESNGDYICTSCVENDPNYVVCDICNMVINTSKEKVYETPDDEYLCESCFEDSKYIECSECGKITKEYKEINGKHICIDCYDNIVDEIEKQTDEEKCSRCNKVFEKDDAQFVNTDGNIICESCYENIYNY